MIDALKGFVPAAVRERLRSLQHDHVFNRAMREFARNPAGWAFVGSPVMRNLVEHWKNPGWVASEEYLVACVEHAIFSKGPILECGSGLTTMLLGVIAAERGNTVWSLEHSATWYQHVQQRLAQRGIEGVQQFFAPIVSYDGFDWYDAPLTNLPDFSLVICDGPPGNTKGGRYGLLQVMQDKLMPGGIVLLDDAIRAEEQRIAERWSTEFGLSREVLGDEAPYVRLTLPDTLSTFRLA